MRRSTPAEREAQPMLSIAFERLITDYAPQLCSLVYNERIPDRHLNLILDWLSILRSRQPDEALELKVLSEIFHALNIALLSCYAFKPVVEENNPAPRGKVHFDLIDTGDALLLEKTRAAAGIIAVNFHGDEGLVLLGAAENELRQLLDAISAAAASTL
jgi:hypothetical protein